MKGSVKGSYNHNDAQIGQFLAEIDDIFKELSFVDGDNLVGFGFVFDGGEGTSFDGFVGLAG